MYGYVLSICFIREMMMMMMINVVSHVIIRFVTGALL